MDDTLAQLPREAPPSLVLLAQQCVVYEWEGRTTAQEASDWLEDLCACTPPDTLPLPPVWPLPPGVSRLSTGHISEPTMSMV
jgi:hypothetical protein